MSDTSVGGAGTVPDHAARSSDRMALLEALATLPRRQRACVVLRYYEDLPVVEVARMLGVAEGTVKSQTARGLAALQSAYAAIRDDDLVVSRRES